MHIEMNKPGPSEALVEQLGPVLATHLAERAVADERPQLAAAQAFQETVVARQNQQGLRGVDGVGQCVARVDIGLFLRLFKKHAAEMHANPRKFWLVTVPQKYPLLGIKPKYVPKAGQAIVTTR